MRTYGAPIVDDPLQARLFLSTVGTKQRAEFELRCRGLWTEVVAQDEIVVVHDSDSTEEEEEELEPPTKKRRLSYSPPKESQTDVIVIEDSSSEFEARPDDPIETPLVLDKQEARDGVKPHETTLGTPENPNPAADGAEDPVQVVKVEWFRKSLQARRLLPLDHFVLYTGRRAAPPPPPTPSKTAPVELSSDLASTVWPLSKAVAQSRKKSPTLEQGALREILERAQADAATTPARRGLPWPGSARGRPRSVGRIPRLLHRSTSEHDEDADGEILDLPDWVKEGKIFSCERRTPPDPPNGPFIDQLRKIKMARLLRGDEIGVRAYGTSIAAVAAFPRELASSREVLALPGCDHKIAALFHEWKLNDGRVREVDEMEADEALRAQRQFYEIWGVGAATAREFYHDRGWRDLDEVVEFGWHTLSRVQQIGLKFYDDFLEKIPRAEVESIAATVLAHARRVRDDGIECCIAGGYRRGKAFCGDVDLILSHRDEPKTLHLVRDVVVSLEREGWITHTLTLRLTNTKRGQRPLALGADGGAGHGFDTLDKAMVVWQDVAGRVKGEAEAEAEGDETTATAANVHRRVDIVVSPWFTVGCAITGWSGETTFQRDLRRYSRKVKFWKFDSSGVRDCATGHVVDLEGVGGPSRNWREAERKVFEGMGLTYLEPWERCTG